MRRLARLALAFAFVTSLVSTLALPAAAARPTDDALALVPPIKAKFAKLPPSQKKLYSWWVESAKKPETRARRIAETLKRVEAGRPAGM